MAVTKNLARGCDFHLNTGTIGVPVWTEIKGVNNYQPTATGNNADTTTFDEDGWQSHIKASRGGSCTIGGMLLSDPDTGDRDPGQAAVEAWALEIGPDSLKQLRVTFPDSSTVLGLASANSTFGGGGTDDPQAWSVEITYSGPITYSALSGSAVPGAPTSVVGTALTDAATVTWTEGTGDVTGYEVTAYDDADDSVVATINTDTKPVYFAGLTTGDDIYFKVKARNGYGLGAASASSTPVEIL